MKELFQENIFFSDGVDKKKVGNNRWPFRVGVRVRDASAGVTFIELPSLY